MSTPASFEMAESHRLDALLLVARHLRRHRYLPEPHTIAVDRVWQRVRLFLLGEPDQELRDLLVWHDSLRDPTADFWRTACGTQRVVSVLGQTADGLPVKVFTGLPYQEGLVTLPVEPNAGQPASRDDLERAASKCARRIGEPAANPNTTIMGLSALQADGLACVVCGADYLRVRIPHVPVGRSVTGSQVFVCVGCRTDDAQRAAGGVLR
ncbi:hypothetical protein [Kutzneria buriramensis]|uniref:Uncharacterized protein n=1 Tax=Kutzneria buriramensis TaxID=1045776 RepID=A0A3E0HPU6_9PSEU|nr:hypothetical protein [Kutzneria buriramensis]REH48438.1 hypothetical protein BCF44_105297 [Kutzneria buriramensis]